MVYQTHLGTPLFCVCLGTLPFHDELVERALVEALLRPCRFVCPYAQGCCG